MASADSQLNSNNGNKPNGQPAPFTLRELLNDIDLADATELSNTNLPAASLDSDWSLTAISKLDDLKKIKEYIDHEPIITLALNLDSSSAETAGQLALGFPSREEVFVIPVAIATKLGASIKKYSDEIVLFDSKERKSLNKVIDLGDVEFKTISASLTSLVPEFKDQSLAVVSKLLLKRDLRAATESTEKLGDIPLTIAKNLQARCETLFQLHLKLNSVEEKAKQEGSANRSDELQAISNEKIALLPENLDHYLEIRAREEYLRRRKS